MTAFYLGPRLSLHDVIAKAVDAYDAKEYADAPGHRLERTVDGVVHSALLPLIAREELLDYDTVYYLCEALHLPHEKFGVIPSLIYVFEND